MGEVLQYHSPPVRNPYYIGYRGCYFYAFSYKIFAENIVFIKFLFKKDNKNLLRYFSKKD